MFHTLIIGKGLVGAAAARYLSLLQQGVAIIGPDEPADDQASVVYASHYDEARVQRVTGWDREWTVLNKTATEAYAQLEAATGIRFHHPVGCLYVCPYGEDAYLKLARQQLEEFQLNAAFYSSGEAIRNHFPHFQFPAQSAGLYEKGPAGYINPRQLLKAQLKQASAQGATQLDDTVIRLQAVSSGYEVHTAAGKTYTAERVVVATGSFLNQMDLLEQKIPLRSKSEVVLLVQLEGEMLAALKDLPSLLYEINEREIEGVYLLPPVPYPDGNTYLKIGSNLPEDRWFTTLEEIQDWFRKGNSDQSAPRLINTLQEIMPTLPVNAHLTKRCIVSYTPNKRPYISPSSQKNIYIAGGCNGYSAMCSDSLGRESAEMVLTGTGKPAFSITYS